MSICPITYIFKILFDRRDQPVTPCKFSSSLNAIPAGIMRCFLCQFSRGYFSGFFFRHVMLPKFLCQMDNVRTSVWMCVAIVVNIWNGQWLLLLKSLLLLQTRISRRQVSDIVFFNANKVWYLLPSRHTTLSQRRRWWCNVMTLHWRWCDVILTSCAIWVYSWKS